MLFAKVMETVMSTVITATSSYSVCNCPECLKSITIVSITVLMRGGSRQKKKKTLHRAGILAARQLGGCIKLKSGASFQPQFFL